MRYFILLFLLSFSAHAKYQKKDLESILNNLVHAIENKKSNLTISQFKAFSVEKCQKPEINWQDLIMMKESARSIEFKFNKNCDIEGSFKPLPFVSFPVKLKLRNLDNFHTYSANNKITASFESKPVVTINIIDGEFIDTEGSIKFNGSYQLRVNPMKGRDAVEENLGGSITITEAYGKKIQINKKFKYKN